MEILITNLAVTAKFITVTVVMVSEETFHCNGNGKFHYRYGLNGDGTFNDSRNYNETFHNNVNGDSDYYFVLFRYPY